MQVSSRDAESLIREGVAALQQGRPAEARAHFEKVTETGAANAQILLLLATACRGQGDLEGEEAALDRLLAQDPRLVRAHIMKGDCRARSGDDLAALGFYKSAIMIADGERLPNDLIAEIERVQAAMKVIRTRFEAHREDLLAAQGHPSAQRSPRFQQSLDILAGRKQAYFQEPTGYYFPELAHIQFFDPAKFDWVVAVEAATVAIRAEIEQLRGAGTAGFRPYIQADPSLPRLDENPLLDSVDWSALFLCENGRKDDEVIRHCPRTWEAIQAAPVPWIANSPTVMFSLLRAGARITPHTGTHNTRLVCHLPLIVPTDCGFRVGNEVRQWEEGKLLIFDDTIEHEAWNNSGEDRIILIFDIWRPELTEQERQEVGALFAGPTI